MTLKVIVSGAYSTGKTTLVESLSAELRNVGLTVTALPDVARGCPMPLNQAQTNDASLWLIGMQLARETEAVAAGPAIVLCDRGIPDILSHLDEAASRGGMGSVGLMRPFLDRWLESYDLILYAQLNESTPIEPDGVRLEDHDFRTLMAGLAQRIVAPLADRTVVLPSDKDARCVAAFQAIMRRFCPNGSSSIS